jgi:ribosome maturation factor RimP
LQKILITKDRILELANDYLKDGDQYVTGIRISPDNHISLFIDGDNGVTIKDCVELSRAIEERLDRNREDYALDVSSHGATTPLIMPRQYKKHIGRAFEIKLVDGSKVEGELISFSLEEIVLQYSVRENKPIGKGKITVVKQQIVKYEQIKEARIKLKY